MHLQPRSHQQGTGDASPENVPLGHKATAWSVFVRSNSAAFKAAFPNMRWADLMPSVSSTYRSLPAEEKEVYSQMARAIREQAAAQQLAVAASQSPPQVAASQQAACSETASMTLCDAPLRATTAGALASAKKRPRVSRPKRISHSAIAAAATAVAERPKGTPAPPPMPLAPLGIKLPMPAIEDPEWRQPQNPPLPRDLSTFLMPLPADSFISMVNASGDMPKVFTGAFHVPGAATLDPKTPPRMPAAVLSCAGASSATPGSPATVLTSQLIKPSLPPDSSAASFLTPTASVIGHVSVAPVSPQSALVPGLSSSPPTAVEMVPSMTETTTSLDMPAQVPSATTAVAETPHVEVSQAQTRVPLQHPAISRAQSYDDVAKIVSLGRSPSVRFQAFLDQTIFAEFDNPYDRMLADSATLNTALNLNDGSGEAGVPSMP